MRICILTIGTRGDIQPYVALGVGLKAAGYQVRIASHTLYRDFVLSRGLEFFPLSGDPQIWYTSYPDSISPSLTTTISSLRRISDVFRSMLPDLLKDSWLACQDVDVIITSVIAIAGYHIAEKLNLPLFISWTDAGARTREFSHPFCYVRPSWGERWNWFTHLAIEQLFWQPIRPIVNRWRQQTLDLPPIPWHESDLIYRQKIPLIYSFSSVVLPKPKDWTDCTYVTGYWFLDRPSDWQPSEQLVQFLQSGSPPVYVGFGSAVSQRAEAFTQLVIEALRRCGQRGILDVSWGGLAKLDLPEQFYVMESSEAPHDWLLPQTAAVVHHGGGGSVAAGLRAGIPSVVLPMLFSQFFWGDRLTELGVSPPAIPMREVSVDRLTAAIHEVMSNQSMRDRAALIGEKIRSEDGVARAIEIIQQHLHRDS